ncbi:hypothetical protein K431DRAFT_252222 [Polychaeton citri CBS 116435]|uniref:PSI domain-containing protein n=1 Tax=Polychaeton citri CBS 116435 TaxID=1314669 RepID=A0A9P4Q1R8_9PEZI|nr:hypothetical protein K431DRAFT_252222 [Polychaeton citri CBS 116435]
MGHKDRLSACWQHQNCNACLGDNSECGWCPSSNACIPANSLFEPVRNKDVCPSRSDRFELRTKALGCNCSTTTLLSVLVTILCTIAALVLLYYIFILVRKFIQTFITGAYKGWEIEVKDDGLRDEHSWSRNRVPRRIWRWTGRAGVRAQGSEQEEVTERSRLLG